MKRNWELDEIIDYFTFLPNELSQVGNKTGETRLGFAVMFKFFQYEAKFPNHKNEIPKTVVEYIAKQINVESYLFEYYELGSRTYFNHKAQIREFFGFREVTNEDMQEMTGLLSKQVFYNDADIESLKEEACKRFRELRIEPPTVDRLDRITRSALHTYESKFFQDTFQKLSKDTITKMDNLISELTVYDESDFDYTDDTNTLSFSDLRSDPGRIGLESVFREVVKLRTIQQLGLAESLFSNMPQKIIKKYKQRAISGQRKRIKSTGEGI